jgi:hypothetical protein
MAVNSSVHHPLFGRFYARAAPATERAVTEFRRELFAGLPGRVVEVGAETGLNFSYYPAAVTQVVAVEPEPYLRERAVAAARHALVPVTVVDGVAERLPADADSFQAAVASLVLCSVTDQPPGVRRAGPGAPARRRAAVLRTRASRDADLSRASRPRLTPCGRGSAAAATSAATPSLPSSTRASRSRHCDASGSRTRIRFPTSPIALCNARLA